MFEVKVSMTGFSSNELESNGTFNSHEDAINDILRMNKAMKAWGRNFFVVYKNRLEIERYVYDGIKLKKVSK